MLCDLQKVNNLLVTFTENVKLLGHCPLQQPSFTDLQKKENSAEIFGLDMPEALCIYKLVKPFCFGESEAEISF